jgi:hypothetical protein
MSNGRATLTKSFGTAGSYTITAVYNVVTTVTATCSQSVSLKLGETATTTATVPSSFKLEVYPNPTSGPVNFKFTLEESTKATLEIFSMTGALMDRIFDADVEKGMEQTARLNRQLPEGVYIYRLTYGTRVKTGKVIKTVTDR